MTVPTQTKTILGIKPGHDGAVALIENAQLIFSFENEKDNGRRYSELNSLTLLKALEACDRFPDVIAMGGWSADSGPNGAPLGAGYEGISEGYSGSGSLTGKAIVNFSSSHERSHILCAYGLSPFPQGQPCYALVWEGHIGSLYYIDQRVKITKLLDVLDDPGIRYAFLYALADPTFQMPRGSIRLSDAGKLMALAAYASDKPVPSEGVRIVDRILDPKIRGQTLGKEDFKDSEYFNCGIAAPKFANLAKYLSNRVHHLFETAVRRLNLQKYPLLISGGCGLNCEWNSKWIASELFSDVFIPPCANDSGSAIGTAIDAMLSLEGTARIQWSVYAGEDPVADASDCPGFQEFQYAPLEVASFLKAGKIFGWMRGRYEIGPRSLGNRSIFAEPSSKSTLERLNRLKKREDFRPIAPVCLEEEMKNYFQPSGPSPYMLEFRTVTTDSIQAVTHVDGSARPQSVSFDQNPQLYELLKAFKEISGVSVLCNTSLNFNGGGFLNRLSDLHEFSIKNDLDGFIFQDRFFLKHHDQ